MLHFLIAVDISTKENVNEAGFKEHGAELLHIVSSTLQKVDHHRALFVDLLVIEVPYRTVKKFGKFGECPSIYQSFCRQLFLNNHVILGHACHEVYPSLFQLRLEVATAWVS